MKLSLEDYIYELPDDRIAQHPLQNRSSSRLLVYKKQRISHHTFKDLGEQLPENSSLIFNDTKVIPARLFFSKSTGAHIEIFLLEPVAPHRQRELAMESKSPVQWHCMVGNLRKWKSEDLELKIPGSEERLRARLVDRTSKIVEFYWEGKEKAFAEILEEVGKIPLPPYMKREATDEDQVNYQTVFAKQKGAVAAPTAGLHFTSELTEKLANKGVKTDYLTLHVSAGTFQPVKEPDVLKHKMHNEEIVIRKDNLQFLLKNEGPIIPVGTTSMRTLESLYWYGVKLSADPEADFHIPQFFPYDHQDLNVPKKLAIRNVLEYMENKNLSQVIGNTEIFIFPGYKFQLCDGLITNFHLPGSTLIMLVAAMVGDNWKNIYKEALFNDYRFLSYGDSSLLLP